MKFYYLTLFLFIIIVTSKKKSKSKKTKRSKIKPFKYDLSQIEPFDPHAASGNGNFSKEMHKMDINYFQIKVKLDYDTKDEARVYDSMVAYFEKWFSLDPKKEIIVVSFMKSPSGQKMINRFVIDYNNKETELAKTYYIDVDYQDGKANVTPYNQDAQLPLDDDVMEDPWRKKYAYTLDKECNFIKEALEATEATCVNVVNEQNYVIPTVYDVTYRDKKNKQHTERVAVIGSTELGGFLEAQDTLSGVYVDREFKENIKQLIYRDVVNGADNLPNEYKDNLMKDSQIQKQMEDLAQHIQNSEGVVNEQIKQTERNYQDALRKQLFMSRMEKVSSYDDHLKTLFLMQNKSDDINAYNIRLQIRKTLKKSNYLHARKIHERRNQYVYEEMRYDELQRKLMDMEYVQDELRDQYYRKMTKIKASK